MITTFRVTDKRTGKSKDFRTKVEAQFRMATLYAQGAAEGDVALQVIETEEKPMPSKKARKPAKPGGKVILSPGTYVTDKPTDVTDKPTDLVSKKKTRTRGRYFVVYPTGNLVGTITRCQSLKELYDCLDSSEELVVVIQGWELKAERQVKYTLKRRVEPCGKR